MICAADFLAAVDLIQAGELTERGIVRKTGLARETIRRIKRRLLADPERVLAAVEQLRNQAKTRCPICGGTVYPPCRACQVRHNPGGMPKPLN